MAGWDRGAADLRPAGAVRPRQHPSCAVHGLRRGGMLGPGRLLRQGALARLSATLRSACGRGLAGRMRGVASHQIAKVLATTRSQQAELLKRGAWMLPAVAFVLSLLVWSAAGFACTPPVERAAYRIEHETFGDIGRQVLTFRCDGDRLVVDTTVDVAVRMLFLTIYRHEARYRGVWQGDRLIRFESHTDDNGKILEVFARAAGGA